MRAAVVFDMDGLMVDTEPLSRRAWAKLLGEFGHELSDDIYYRMIGHRTDVSAQLALNAYSLPIGAAEIVQRKEQIFDEIRAKGVPPMPGLMELQAEIEKRGLMWAVATSSPRHHAQIVLSQLGLLDSCHVIAAGDEVAYGKPAPDIYLLAAERLGIHPDQCLALEDSQPGAQAAIAAGMKVVVIPNGQTRAASFPSAHYIFDSLHDVADRLDLLLRE